MRACARARFFQFPFPYCFIVLALPPFSYCFSQTMKSLGGTTENQKTVERYWQRWDIEFSSLNLDAEIGRARARAPFSNFNVLIFL